MIFLPLDRSITSLTAYALAGRWALVITIVSYDETLIKSPTGPLLENLPNPLRVVHNGNIAVTH